MSEPEMSKGFFGAVNADRRVAVVVRAGAALLRGGDTGANPSTGAATKSHSRSVWRQQVLVMLVGLRDQETNADDDGKKRV